MKRRSFLLTAPVGISALVAIKSALSQQNTNTVRLRENITAFSNDKNKIADLRGAVTAMKARPVQDPMSWRFWAAVHQYPIDKADLDRQKFPTTIKSELKAADLWVAPQNIKGSWYQCSHGFDSVPEPGIHFLSWHRLYLFCFEKILRELSASRNISLPYWNPISDPQLPTIFRQKENNPLYSPLRDEQINDGNNVSGLNYSSLTAGDMFAALVRVDGLQFRGFSRGIEHNIHNLGHSAISGLMGHPYTAALDPIFWLHHANVDRMWSIWLKTHPARNDASIAAGWLARQFAFYDLGTPSDVQVERFLSNEIGYRYDDETMPSFDEAPVRIVEQPKKVIKGKKIGFTVPDQRSRARNLTLGGEGLAVRLPLSDDDRRDFSNISNAKTMDGNNSRLILVLRGVRLGKDALRYGFRYEVYLNIPISQGDSNLTTDSHLVGNFGPFELACNSQACGEQGRTLRFELNTSIQSQLDSKDVLPNNAFISFVREGARDATKKLLPISENAQLVEITSLTFEREK